MPADRPGFNNNEEEGVVAAQTPPVVELTARQQRVLHYLARRRMRNARIIRRPTYGSIVEEAPAEEARTIRTPPEAETIANDHEAAYDAVKPANADTLIEAPVSGPGAEEAEQFLVE